MAGGFFNLQSQKRAPRVSTIAGCGGCGLHKTCYTPKMGATGRGVLPLLFIAEAPGGKEDRRGEQLIGKAGQRLRKVGKKHGVDIDDARKINAVNCRPPKNRTPTDSEVDACRPMVFEEIKAHPPKVIVVMGGPATRSLIQHRMLGEDRFGGITKWRGWTIPDRDLNAWVCPTFHPSYVEREKHKNPIVKKIFEQDVAAAFRLLDKDLPNYRPEEEGVTVATDLDDIQRFLRGLIDSPPSFITLDYETTGLKPHAIGHEIVCASITTSKDPEGAFAFLTKNNRVKLLLREVLRDRRIKKIAANMKFEEIWSRVKLRTRVEGWLWDSMLAAHVLDNRPGITGLKFQAYVQFGRIDYDSHLGSLLQGEDPDNANSLNRIHEIPVQDLLLYCGCDTIFETRLAIRQMKLMGILDPKYFARNGYRPGREWAPPTEENEDSRKTRSRKLISRTLNDSVGT